jgi:hypothetical protein
MSKLRQNTIISLITDNVEEMGGKIIYLKGQFCGGKRNQCSGLFYLDAEDRPIIKVATDGFKNNEHWLGLLIHEYCHFEQWRNDAKVWRDYECVDVSLEQIFKTPKKFKKEIVDLISLELDCEKRSVRIIKNNGLFDVKKYILTSNAILLKYVYLYHFGEWPKKSVKYKNLLDACPTKLLKSAQSYFELKKENLRDLFKL